MCGPNGVESMLSSRLVMKPKKAFNDESFRGGSFGTVRWGRRLGDTSSLGWPNYAFRASNIRNRLGATFS